MKKFFFILLFSVALFSAPRPTSADLNACYQKNRYSEFTYKGNVAVALGTNLAAVIYDKDKKLQKGDYIKFDPYLGLYLIKTKETLKAPFMFDETQTEDGAFVNVLERNVTDIGHIKKFGVNLGELDELSFDTNKTGLLLCDCCSMLGIAVGKDKFVGNRYLKNFMKYDDVYYGDIGVSFIDENGTLIVKNSNPLGIGNKLLGGDEIVKVNGKTPNNLRELNEMILFAPKGSELEFFILRDGKAQNIDIKMQGAAPKITNVLKTPKKSVRPKTFSFLHAYGITLNKDLSIEYIMPKSKAMIAGFKIGDKILQIDKKSIKTQSDIEKIMKNNKRKFYYLVSRDDFQFFIRVYK